MVEQADSSIVWLIHDVVVRNADKKAIGVSRQRVGPSGRQAHCQLFVTLSDISCLTRNPVARRLYLPKNWARDPVRRKLAGVAASVDYLTRWELAIDLVRRALPARPAGSPEPIAVADASYGHGMAFRTGLTTMGIPYVVEVPALTLVRPGPGGHAQGPPAPWAAEQLVLRLDPLAETTHEGVRYVAWRMHPASRMDGVGAVRPAEWLVAEWPATKRPGRFWLSTLGADVPLGRIVHLAVRVDAEGRPHDPSVTAAAAT